MSMMRMNQILEIDEETMNAVIQPGVLLMEIIEEAANHNLLYAPDPGEKSASVGGNVMTNAGGMRAVKYGVTRDYVRGLEVVLADGSVLMLGGKTSKNSSGYSLKDLIVGSEGTLAVVTKIIMKLLPKPRAMTSLLIPFNTLGQALTLVPKIMRLPAVATTIEFMEKEVIQDAQDYLGKDFPNKEFNAYLIVSYSANTPEEMQAMITTALSWLCKRARKMSLSPIRRSARAASGMPAELFWRRLKTQRRRWMNVMLLWTSTRWLSSVSSPVICRCRRTYGSAALAMRGTAICISTC